MLKRNFLTALVPVIAATISAPTLAGESLTVVEKSRKAEVRAVVMVPTAEFDLQTRAGEKALMNRVRDAADTACDSALGVAAHPNDKFNCWAAAMRDATGQVDDLVERTRLAAAGNAPILASNISVRIAR
ncbi:UrcA family protein [Altererythrobacter salegens]|uniref:UrcA family protein n=1 Tax=Croceibacterium salegens TaxID=1737568 RepID=A0A6I4SZC2_9SPHN|nr:UrcA family protein [Croceibacterium salegens]MXO61351.1 UrcA family protein [Croceibacterium salegens]